MRKLFTTLKSVIAVAIVASMTLASSCSYDDTAIKNRVDKVEKDLAALTERVTALENKLKSDVAALTELINNKAVVTNLTTDANGVTTVELSNGKSFKVYPECTVEDTDTNTYIGVEAEEGVLYFAVFEMGEFKEWLTINGEKVPVYDGNDQCECVPVTDTNDDTYVAPYYDEEDGEYYYAVLDRMDDNKFVDWYYDNGEKVPVYDGNDDTLCECEPVDLKFQVNMESGMLEFSVDGGLTWNPTGLSAADAGQQVIAGVTDNGNNTVTFTLAGNSSFSVIKADLIEFDATRTQLYVLPGETKEINFTINTAVADVNVMNQPLGWSAEVVLAPVDEDGEGDEVDPGMGILAAGGTELVLKITGPAQEFVDAGFAAKKGEIAVHFNGNNGTCQVGKIAVNLAELTLAVDAEGNVHIENSITNVETDPMGDVFVEFAPIQIGVMTKACYDEYLAGTLDILAANYDGYINYTTGGFNNVVDRVQYQEGICEKEVYDITVDDVRRMFYPYYEFVPGGEYVIFLYTEEEMDMDYYEVYPVLDSAIMAYYKSVIIEVSVVDGSISWNDATLNLSLAGYTNYLVGWIATSDVEEYIEWGYCTDLNSYLDIYLKSQYGGGGINTNAGVILAEGMPLNTEIKLSEMAEYSLTAWAPSVKFDTTYYLFVYPFNMESEMDLYTLSPSHKDTFLFGTFTTASLTPGSFEVNPTYELTFGQYSLQATVTFTEEYTVYYAYYTTPAVEEDVRVAEVIKDCYFPETGTVVYTDTYNTEAKYLNMVIINAEGKYVFVEKVVEPEPLPEVAINSFEYLGRYYDLDNDPSTSNGNYIYLVKCADGKEYKIEVYYAYCNEDGTIIDSIKRISSATSSVREVLPGREYFIPTTQGEKLNPLLISKEIFVSNIVDKPMSISKAIYTTFTGISPLIANEITYRAGLDADYPVSSLDEAQLLHLANNFVWFMEDIQEHKYTPNIVRNGKEPIDYASVPLTMYGHYESTSFDTISEVLENYYAEKNVYSRIRQKSVDLRKIVATALERNVKKYDLQIKQQKDAEKKEKYKLYGELLQAYGYGIEPGAKFAEVENYYDNNALIKIPLDADLSALDNSKKYFEKYGKLKRTSEALEGLIEETHTQIVHLESIQNALDIATSADDLIQIKEELMEYGFIKKNRSAKKEKSKSKPFHYRSSDGYDIFVGKNNYQNDELSFKVATGNDWWFHAKGMPGSHVIVKANNEELPDRVFEEAGRLAGYYSKGRDNEKIEIDYLQKKNLKKPSGAAPGFVVYYTNYSLVIEPDITGIELISD